MNRYDLFGYPLFFVLALEIFLGLILLRQNPRNSPVNKAVAVYAFASAGYSLFTAIIYVRTSLGLPIDIYARLNWAGWLSIPAALQSIFYMHDEKSRMARNVGFVLYPFWSIMLVLCLFTELVEPSGYSLNPRVDHNGPFENPARLFGALLIVWVMYEVYKLRKQSSGMKRKQVNHFFYGTMIFASGSALIAGFLQLFGGFGLDPGLGAYFSFPWVVLTFYAITRYRLFDISIIISRLLTVVFLSLTVSVLHIWLFKLFEPAMGSTLAILISLFLIGTVFFGTHISRTVQWRIHNIIVKDKYDYQRILKESIKASVTILDLQELLHYLIDSMNKSLGAESVSLFLKGRDGRYAMRLGKGADCIETSCEVPAAVISWLRRIRRVGVREELEDLLPAEELTPVNEFMQRIGAELLIPLMYKGQLEGFLTLGFKGSREPYLQSDIDLLELLAGQAAIAIQNAQLYEETRQTKESLLASESKFRTLAETAAMGIFIHQGGNFLYANRAAEIIGGYTVDEYLTMNFMSLVHPDFIEMVKARARERLKGGSNVPSQYEFKIVRKNGEERWVLMTGGIAEFDGKPAVIGTLIDITERKQAEEERYQMALLVESSSDFIGMTTMDGQVLFVNGAGQKLVGLSSGEDVKKMSLTAFFMQEDLPVLVEQLLPNDAWRGEFRLKHFKTGLPIPVDMYEFTVTDEKTGRPMARAAVIRDITALKRAREERERYYQQLQEMTQSLKESELRFRTLAETTTAAIFIHQGQKLVYANTAGEIMTGHSREELLQEDFWALIHPDYQDLAKNRGQARLRGERMPKEYEFKFMTKKGENRWAATTAGVIEYGGKPAIIATLFDITEWKRAEEAKVKFYEESVRQYQERIEEEKRHRMEKEKILMDLHDGIGGITTNISILSQLALKTKGRENVTRMLSTISRLSQEGISEIRSFMHSLDSKELSWRTLAAEFRSQGRNMVETHNIKFSIETQVGDAHEQPGSLVWLNMFKIYKEALTNVIKHSSATAVTVGFLVNPEGVRLTIQDNGVGMRAGAGSGRGLSNMKTRAEDIGGVVNLFREKGTAVVLKLPLPLKYPAGGMVKL